MAKKDWESARQYFRRLIDAFPQSEHQPDARIALADSYFEEGGTGNYVLAVSSYREFLTLYPQHPKSDYAQFRAAESYFKQKNTPDRDQTATEQALEEYQRLLDVYPQSTCVEPARERIRECRQTLARVALPGRLLLPEDAQVLALRHRPLRDDRLGVSRLREVRRGPLPAGAVPGVRRPLRRGPAPPRPASRRSSRRARSSRRRRSSKPPSRPPGVPAAPAPAPAGPPPPDKPAAAPARAVRRPGATDLKCHFEDARKDLLTTGLFS